jgi:hypothetical protein
MKRFICLLMMSAALAGLAGTAVVRAADLPMSPVEQQVVEASSTVTITIEALAFKRWTDDVLLSYIADSDWELSTDDLAEDYAPGLAASLYFAMDGGWGVRLAGLYASGSGAGEMISGGEQLGATYSDSYNPDNLVFQNSEGAFSMNADQQWSLAGVNASATIDLGAGAKVTVGPAWLRYANALHSTVVETEGDADNVDAVDISSTNDLFGGVVGLEAMLPVGDALTVGGRIAGGVYAAHKVLDRSYEAVGLIDSPYVSDLMTDNSSSDGIATSIEIAPRAALAISPNISLTLGGSFIWINGIDESADHFQSLGTDNGPGAIAEESPGSTSVTFGGVSLGLTGTF